MRSSTVDVEVQDKETIVNLTRERYILGKIELMIAFLRNELENTKKGNP